VLGRHTLLLGLGVVLLIIAAGCAPAYHAYPCGCVPYGYYAEPPLLFTNYDGCAAPPSEPSP
jgi:hypothetical protein